MHTLLITTMFALAYLLIVAVALSLCVMAKRADEQAERIHRKLELDE